MEYTVSHDALGTHIDWSLDDVTARQIDWFWSNMEKGFILWHPEQHETLLWPRPPRHGDLRGAIHNAPQTWDDGRRQDLYIRFEPLDTVAPHIRDVICHRHVIVVAGIGLSLDEMQQGEPWGYRIHQWTASDRGVTGKSSAIGTRRPETADEGKVWAAHAMQEVGNWEVFLPRLYDLYKVVKDPRRNPFTDLSVEGTGRAARYLHMA